MSADFGLKIRFALFKVAALSKSRALLNAAGNSLFRRLQRHRDWDRRFTLTRARNEAVWLGLLGNLQEELYDALNTLSGRNDDDWFQRYLYYTATHIYLTVEGYISLRRSGRYDASKLLIRSALEAVIRLEAIRKKPELLFRIVYTEFRPA